MSIHANHGDFNGASEVEVVVAQVIGRGLELILCHTSCVVHSLVQDRLGSSNCHLVRDHVEVIEGVSLNLDNSGVNDCAVTWIEAVLGGLHKNTVVVFAVNQAVENLGLVSRTGVLEQVSDQSHFMLLDLSSHGGTSNAVSVNDDFLREIFSIFLIITHGIIDETLNDMGSLYSNELFLDLSAGFARE